MARRDLQYRLKRTRMNADQIIVQIGGFNLIEWSPNLFSMMSNVYSD